MLDVRDLTVHYRTARGLVTAVRRAALRVQRGEIVGLAGASGCGKSSLVRAVLRLLPPHAEVSGTIHLNDEDMYTMSWARLRQVRWTEAALAFPGAAHALNPGRRIGWQIAQPTRLHLGQSRRAAASWAADRLEEVRIPASRARAFPHELSGGECQRIMIAMALACDPRLLIMDEATTGLDVGLRSEIVALVRDLAVRRHMTVLVISHDPAILTTMCPRLVTMHDGVTHDDAVTRCRPHGDTSARTSNEVANPIPAGRTRASRHRDETQPILRATQLVVPRAGRRSRPAALVLDGVSIDLNPGELLVLSGASGVGKTTLVRTLVGLVRPTRGQIMFEGTPLSYTGRGLRSYRRKVQWVPQDTCGTIDPRRTVDQVVAEGLAVYRVSEGAKHRVGEVLDRVCLPTSRRFLASPAPDLSDGQRQRLLLAAALVLEPPVLLADEPLASVDPATSATILDVLRARCDQLNVAVLIVTHDVDTVRAADRQVVLQNGRIVESPDIATSHPEPPWPGPRLVPTP